MKSIDLIIEQLTHNEYDQLLTDMYIEHSCLEYQRNRYLAALRIFKETFGDGDVSIYSAPGRSEIGGNHTDHQRGNVLAAAIQKDAIAVVRKTDNNTIRLLSEGYDMEIIDLTDLMVHTEEFGTTRALVRGVLAGFSQRNYTIGGFDAYITSDVLIGAGLSSSAALETILGAILSGLYNHMNISDIEIAIIGQYAENTYFGKPCGLMDQMACSVGNMVQINFANPTEPIIKRLECDLSALGYCICVTNTGGSHADLTADYAAIPEEMAKAAAVFGKQYLSEVSYEDIYTRLSDIRAAAGDRAALRAIHFTEENRRAVREALALNADDISLFLELVKESGDSSYKYLQNIYSDHDSYHQNLSIALALSEHILQKRGACRVHGGGFAGTIQAFVPLDMVSDYKDGMDAIFGKDSCSILYVRKNGGIKVIS